MKLLIATVASLLALAKTVGAVTFDATNTASNTSGGQRFDKAVGVDYAKQVLSNASSFIWYTFNQSSPADRRPVNAVALVVEDFNGIAVTRNNVIHLSVQYVEGYSGDVKTELTGMLYHEVTLVWQWTGQLEGNGGLLRGIADYVRLKAGYPERHWVKPGQGDKWDQGFDVTARFLDYCDSLQPGFVAQLNAKMKYGYSDAFFAQILGKGVQQLWQNYKVHVNEGNASVPDGTTPSDSLSRNTSNKRPIILLIVIPAVTTLCLISAISICVWRRTRTRSRLKKTLSCTTYSDDIKEIQAVMLDPLLIRAATDNFAEVNKLGEGGFGQVYKGLLPNGLEVAVKRLSNGSKQGIRELKSELLLVTKLQHRNLVKLIGACIHEEEKLLVYEYIPNKSLDAFIFDDEKRKQLTWETRYKIICGIARGMMYLHDESRVKVIHRDLKPSNILLEKDMTPKICDFGLARVFEGDHTKDITRRVAGTYGYMAPEYAVLGHVSSKSDVFSFGVIVLEIVTGRRNTTSSESMMAEHLLSFVWENWTRGSVKEIVDPSLRHNCAENETLKCIHIGLLCVQENPSDRPSMSNVILMLAGRSPTLPSPSRPAFLFRLDNAHHAHHEGANELQEGSNKYSSSFNKATITELEPR